MEAASPRLAGCGKNAKVSLRSLILRGNNSAALREEIYTLCERRTSFREFFSRQAAKVAKEKREYFCNDFPRLMLFSNDFPRLFTTYARYRSLSAEVCSSCTFRSSCRARPLVAVRHCRVPNFPSGVRTGTRAALNNWPINLFTCDSSVI